MTHNTNQNEQVEEEPRNTVESNHHMEDKEDDKQQIDKDDNDNENNSNNNHVHDELQAQQEENESNHHQQQQQIEAKEDEGDMETHRAQNDCSRQDATFLKPPASDAVRNVSLSSSSRAEEAEATGAGGAAATVAAATTTSTTPSSSPAAVEAAAETAAAGAETTAAANQEDYITSIDSISKVQTNLPPVQDTRHSIEHAAAKAAEETEEEKEEEGSLSPSPPSSPPSPPPLPQSSLKPPPSNGATSLKPPPTPPNDRETTLKPPPTRAMISDRAAFTTHAATTSAWQMSPTPTTTISAAAVMVVEEETYQSAHHDDNHSNGALHHPQHQSVNIPYLPKHDMYNEYILPVLQAQPIGNDEEQAILPPQQQEQPSSNRSIRTASPSRNEISNNQQHEQPQEPLDVRILMTTATMEPVTVHVDEQLVQNQQESSSPEQQHHSYRSRYNKHAFSNRTLIWIAIVMTMVMLAVVVPVVVVVVENDGKEEEDETNKGESTLLPFRQRTVYALQFGTGVMGCQAPRDMAPMRAWCRHAERLVVLDSWNADCTFANDKASDDPEENTTSSRTEVHCWAKTTDDFEMPHDLGSYVPQGEPDSTTFDANTLVYWPAYFNVTRAWVMIACDSPVYDTVTTTTTLTTSPRLMSEYLINDPPKNNEETLLDEVNRMTATNDTIVNRESEPVVCSHVWFSQSVGRDDAAPFRNFYGGAIGVFATQGQFCPMDDGDNGTIDLRVTACNDGEFMAVGEYQGLGGGGHGNNNSNSSLLTDSTDDPDDNTRMGFCAARETCMRDVLDCPEPGKLEDVLDSNSPSPCRTDVSCEPGWARVSSFVDTRSDESCTILLLANDDDDDDDDGNGDGVPLDGSMSHWWTKQSLLNFLEMQLIESQDVISALVDDLLFEF